MATLDYSSARVSTLRRSPERRALHEVGLVQLDAAEPTNAPLVAPAARAEEEAEIAALPIPPWTTDDELVTLWLHGKSPHTIRAYGEDVAAFRAFTGKGLTSAPISAAQAAGSIVGTWRLVSLVEEETESKAQHKNFGDDPSGILTYTADGRMSIIFADPKRAAPASPKATDAEAAQLYRSMVAYTGSYRLEGGKVLVKVDVSWNRAWDGHDRPPITVEINGDRLTYKTAPFVSPFLGKQSRRSSGSAQNEAVSRERLCCKGRLALLRHFGCRRCVIVTLRP
jgi:hypothetical protein